jgi:hypothetical protein
MGNYGPFEARVGIWLRATNFVDLIVRDQDDVTEWRLWGASTLNDAYGDPTGSGVGGVWPTTMLTAAKGRMATSPSIVKRGYAGLAPDNRQNFASFVYDPDDFLAPATPPPFLSDSETFYVRAQMKRLAGGWAAVPAGAPLNANRPIMGPILVIPTVQAMGMASLSINLTGIAPSGTGAVIGSAPIFDETFQAPIPMHIILPRPISNFVITNLSDDADTALLVSFGIGQPWHPIYGGMGNLSQLSSDSLGGGTRDLILATTAAAGGSPFAILAVCPGA